MKNNDACDTMESIIREKNLENRISILGNYDEMPLILDVIQVAKILRIGRSSAYCLFRSADFPGFRVAGQLRVTKYDFLEYLVRLRMEK